MHDHEPLESWRAAFRNGVGPVLSTPALTALQRALAVDDVRLIQGGCVLPPPLQPVLLWPAQSACAIGLAGWLGEGKKTVGEVNDFFADVCVAADARLGEPAACRWFTNWFDSTPRQVMRQQLLAEVCRALDARDALDPVFTGDAA